MSLADAISAVAAEKHLAKKGGKTITAKERKKAATVRVGGKSKFPIPPGDKGHARAALARLNQAKPPLTTSQKKAVRSRAESVLGGD